MSAPDDRVQLAEEPDFELGALRVCPSSCRIVHGAGEVRIEAQTMSVLVLLARNLGATVSRQALIDACWQGRIVSDDAVARAIAKVRALTREMTPPPFVLETVPKVGYRLVLSTAVRLGEEARPEPEPPVARRQWTPIVRLAAAAGPVLLLVWVTAELAQAWFPPRPTQTEVVSAIFSRPIQSTEVVDALLNVDEARLQRYLEGGWNPNWHLDSESNRALHTLMLACERNPTHDRAAVVRVARLLVEAGAEPTAANGWGDTAEDIARSPRYCGAEHPVVAYLEGL